MLLCFECASQRRSASYDKLNNICSTFGDVASSCGLVVLRATVLVVAFRSGCMSRSAHVFHCLVHDSEHRYGKSPDCRDVKAVRSEGV